MYSPTFPILWREEEEKWRQDGLLLGVSVNPLTQKIMRLRSKSNHLANIRTFILLYALSLARLLAFQVTKVLQHGPVIHRAPLLAPIDVSGEAIARSSPEVTKILFAKTTEVDCRLVALYAVATVHATSFSFMRHRDVTPTVRRIMWVDPF